MKLCLALLSVIDGSQAFAPQSNSRATVSLFGGNPIANFFEELDNFIDDATSRRLGNGAAFYGKRKSSFYGENDSGKKRDNEVADPTGKWSINTEALEYTEQLSMYLFRRLLELVFNHN